MPTFNFISVVINLWPTGSNAQTESEEKKMMIASSAVELKQAFTLDHLHFFLALLESTCTVKVSMTSLEEHSDTHFRGC